MSDKKLFVVETVTTFVNRYVVEAKSLEHALDEVSMVDSGAEEDYFEPVISIPVTEMIVDGKKIGMKAFNKMLKGEHANSPWMGEKLIRKINYDM
jgi:hypothetical protein